MIKFFIVLGIAYILNFMTLQWLLMAMNPYTAQLGAAIVYTISSFVMARYFVFKEAR
jgi:putative flippase GtrA